MKGGLHSFAYEYHVDNCIPSQTLSGKTDSGFLCAGAQSALAVLAALALLHSSKPRTCDSCSPGLLSQMFCKHTLFLCSVEFTVKTGSSTLTRSTSKSEGKAHLIDASASET